MGRGLPVLTPGTDRPWRPAVGTCQVLRAPAGLCQQWQTVQGRAADAYHHARIKIIGLPGHTLHTLNLATMLSLTCSNDYERRKHTSGLSAIPYVCGLHMYDNGAAVAALPFFM